MPDYCGLWEAIGRELFECVNPIDDYEKAPDFIFHHLIAGWMEAEEQWDRQHMDDGDDDAAAQGRREARAAIKTSLRIVTIDGKNVDPS